MSLTQINGATQIRSGTITFDRLVSGFQLPLSSVAGSASLLQASGTVALTASLNMGGNTIINVSSPVNATDGANKSYVDALISGFKLHGAQVVSVANISTLSGLPTIDGVTMVAGAVALLTAQTTASQNGPWVVASGAWARPSWWASGSSIAEGNYFIIDPDGTTYKNTKWFITTTGSITVDTTSVTFTQDLSGTTYSAGSGLALSGTSFSTVTGNGVSIVSNAITAVGNSTNLISVTASGIGISSGASAQLIQANSSGTPTWTTVSGDVSISNTGVTAVNSSQSGGFIKYTNSIANEVPGGAINGSNTSFTLANTPLTSSVQLYYEGILQQPGSGNDYTISGNTITTLFTPVTGEKLLASYNK